MSITNELLQTIQYGIDKNNETAQFSKEFIGVIEEILDTNKYKIQYNNTSYVMATANSLGLSVYDKVHIVVPNNNTKNKYILEDLIKSYSGSGTGTTSGVSTVDGKSGDVVLAGVYAKKTDVYTKLEVDALLSSIPTKISELQNDSGFIDKELDPTVPSHVKAIKDTDITKWNNKSDFSGNYNDLSNKPSIPSTKADIGLGSVDNTADIDKNVSSAKKLSSKINITLSGDTSGTVSTDLSGNVNINVSVTDDSHSHIINNIDGLDGELSLKAPLISPTFTGTPNAPTATTGTATKQVATTEFVQNALASSGVSGSCILAICNTAIDVADKVVTISGYTPASGNEIMIKFTYGSYVDAVTLNINNIGAKSVLYMNASPERLKANVFYKLYYNGTSWNIVGELAEYVTNIGIFVDKNAWILTGTKYTNTIAVEGITQDCYPIYSIVPADETIGVTAAELEAYNLIELYTIDGYIVLLAESIPSINFTILVKDDLGTGDNLIGNYAQIVNAVNTLQTNVTTLQTNANTKDILFSGNFSAVSSFINISDYTGYKKLTFEIAETDGTTLIYEYIDIPVISLVGKKVRLVASGTTSLNGVISYDCAMIIVDFTSATKLTIYGNTKGAWYTGIYISKIIGYK